MNNVQRKSLSFLQAHCMTNRERASKKKRFCTKHKRLDAANCFRESSALMIVLSHRFSVPLGAAVEILDQKRARRTMRIYSAEQRKGGRRDVRQVRLQRGRHHSGARLSHPPHAPQLVEGIPGQRRRVPGKEASQAEVFRRGEAGRGRLLPLNLNLPRFH